MLGGTKQPPSVDALVPRDPGIVILAVLPFSNIGGDPSEQYFIDGLTEDVITSLPKLSGLRVIARSSAFAFAEVEAAPREAAEQLGVRSVLPGSVRRGTTGCASPPSWWIRTTAPTCGRNSSMAGLAICSRSRTRCWSRRRGPFR